MIYALEEEQIRDAVVLDEGVPFTVYDCVNLMEETAGIYPVTRKEHAMDPASFPDRVLVWVKNGSEAESIVEDLTAGGFTLAKLGSTHFSDVYVVARETETDAGATDYRNDRILYGSRARSRKNLPGAKGADASGGDPAAAKIEIE
ncbi:MAG: hypothetical protein Q4D81_06075 [Eubacteriales bacterium]|nr:hypothetical protein [Eubacteriales bacterium]